MGGTQVWVTVSMFIKRNFRKKFPFNYTYYTMTHKCWMALQGRRVYLALSSGGCGSASWTGSWGCSSASSTRHSLLRHHCRHNAMGAVVPQVGHIPQVELDEGRLRAPVGSLHDVPEAPGVGEHQGGSPCSNLMRPGHYPWQIWSRPHVGRWK